MQSKTSFFNRTVFTKTLRRFWPMWMGYALLWFLIVPLAIIHGGMENWTELQMVNSLLNIAAVGSPLVLFAASILTAMAVFGWLYQSRSVSFTTALPVSRSGMFLSCAASGAAVLLGVNVLTTLVGWLCAALTGYELGGVLLTFLAISSLDALCFYGFALLCAQLTGSLLILPLVYAVLQLAAVVVERMVAYLSQCIIFGLDLGSGVMQYLSPVCGRVTRCYVAPILSEQGERNVIGYQLRGWGIVIAYAVFGGVCVLLAWALFKRRRMESAGDTVAIRLLKPIFRWCMALGSAMVFAAGVYYLLYQGRYVPGDMTHALIITGLLVVGGLLGWFVADMLIYKFFPVFSYHWKGAVLLAALLITVTMAAELDVLGLEKRIPEAEDCEMARVIVGGDVCLLYETENIRTVTEIHREIVENKAYHEGRYAGGNRVVEILYFRDDNEKEAPFLTRTYRIACGEEEKNDPNSAIRSLERLMNRSECIQRRKELRIPVGEDTIDFARVGCYRNYSSMDPNESYFGDITGRQRDGLLLTREEACQLYWECILPDIQDGTLGRIWLVEDESYARTVLNLEIDISLVLLGDGGEQSGEYFYTVPTVDSVRTNAWLEARGVKLETLWEHMEASDALWRLDTANEGKFAATADIPVK